jgi:hypothetical protein
MITGNADADCWMQIRLSVSMPPIPRHHDVKKHEVERFPADQLDRGEPTVCLYHFKATALNTPRQNGAVITDIVHDQQTEPGTLVVLGRTGSINFRSQHCKVRRLGRSMLTSAYLSDRQGCGIRQRLATKSYKIVPWRATADEDGQYCFAVAL